MNNEPILFEKIPLLKEEFFNRYFELSRDVEYHVLLESGRAGRYSVAGLTPFAVIRGNQDTVEIWEEGETKNDQGDPFTVLEKWMERFTFPAINGLPDFQGGVIGYISYDYAQCIEKLPNQAVADLDMPLIYFLAFDEWVVFDHEEESLWCMVLNNGDASSKLTNLKKLWEMDQAQDELSHFEHNRTESKVEVSFTEEEFINAVEKVQDYISNGDVFQVNLSVRQSKAITVPPIEIYKELRQLNPSPYMGYMHTPDFQIISGSPELLIQKSGDRISTRPIGGTRPRGNDESEDKKLLQELINNEKERAEHIMLVDLERNDLGRVCRYGTVQVDELMTIEKYSHVMHIVSHISGEISADKRASDLIAAVFPGGTITGTPKIRTMEIIEELEPVKRNIYTGSLGWFGYNQDLLFNILIRTMLVKDGMSHVQAGAGIVIDSIPQAEYKESLKKAEALWKALELAESKVKKR